MLGARETSPEFDHTVWKRDVSPTEEWSTSQVLLPALPLPDCIAPSSHGRCWRGIVVLSASFHRMNRQQFCSPALTLCHKFASSMMSKLGSLPGRPVLLQLQQYFPTSIVVCQLCLQECRQVGDALDFGFL